MNIQITVPCIQKVNSTVQDNDLLFPVYYGNGWVNEQACQPGNTSDVPIAEHFERFHELTVLYWLWKHADAGSEYCGFFQADQFLALRDKRPFDERDNDTISCIRYPFLDERALDMFGIHQEDLEIELRDVDVILPHSIDVTRLVFPRSTLVENVDYAETLSGEIVDPYRSERLTFQNAEQYYEKNPLQFNMEDLDQLKKVLADEAPEYLPDLERYLSGKMVVHRIGFVMKRELLDEYCEWLFNLLMRLDRVMDQSQYGEFRLHSLSGFAALLTELYFSKKRDSLKIQRRKFVHFENIEDGERLKPAFSENNIALMFVSSNMYLPYCSVLVQSVIEHASEENNYDIIILQSEEVTDFNKRVMTAMVSERPNISIRFYNPKRYLYTYNLQAAKLYTETTIYRISAPYILEDYDRVVVTDSDLVFERDAAELFHTQMGNNLIAAVIDDCTIGRMAGASPGRLEYYTDDLKLKEPYRYINTGVMVWNLKEFRRTYSESQTMEFASSRRFLIQEQDILNIMAEGRIEYLDRRWDTYVFGGDYNRVYGFTPKEIHDGLMEARKEPYVVHYVGRSVVKPKPWENPLMDFSEYFWKYARKSPYYEALLYLMMKKHDDTLLKRARGLVKREISAANANSQKKQVRRTRWYDRILPIGSRRRGFLKKIYRKFVKTGK